MSLSAVLSAHIFAALLVMLFGPLVVQYFNRRRRARKRLVRASLALINHYRYVKDVGSAFSVGPIIRDNPTSLYYHEVLRAKYMNELIEATKHVN